MLVAKSIELKKNWAEGKLPRLLQGKVLALIFEKPSTRTRVGFETAALQLGADVIYLRSDELQLRRGEPVKDTARVLGSYLDGLVIRTHDPTVLEEFAKFSKVPVINALSDIEHPTQTICDMITLKELRGQLQGLRFTWIGDGNNVCNSWILGASLVGMHMTVACPRRFEPDRSITDRARRQCEVSGGSLRIVRDPAEAARGADIIYTDVWVSMGHEKEAAKRKRAFRRFQVNDKLLALAKNDAVVMHCLPAHRGMEITDSVLDGKQSIVWQQAENKLHGARGILALLLC
jgi:ornithine carbamoyltransferase